jgi:signal transduction histidine kinase
MLGRIYSIALLAIMVEALVNGVGQFKYLNPAVFFISASLIVITTLGVIINQWFFSFSKTWLQAVAIATLVGLLSWPLHLVDSANLPADFQPWIWWTLGIGALAAGTSFRFSIGVGYLVLVPAIWVVIRTSDSGGSAPLIVAIQDATHVLIFASILVAMVLALRWEAGKVDSANQLAISSAVESARVEAIELERSRMDALVHDSVLTTLLVAARAENADQVATAQKSARDAIDRLQQAGSDESLREEMTLASFFAALEGKVKNQSADFLVTVDRLNDLPIPSEIAQALTEATLQAVDNSLKHAGVATDRIVRLRGQKAGLKIVVSDNGRGFRPSQVARDRLGIRSSIITRVEQVGGRVFIDSQPGSGTNVVIEWGSGD